MGVFLLLASQTPTFFLSTRPQAFVDQFQKQPLFNMGEFDECREAARQLIDEYKAAETDDYLSWQPSPRGASSAVAAPVASAAADPRTAAAAADGGDGY